MGTGVRHTLFGILAQPHTSRVPGASQLTSVRLSFPRHLPYRLLSRLGEKMPAKLLAWQSPGSVSFLTLCLSFSKTHGSRIMIHVCLGDIPTTAHSWYHTGLVGMKPSLGATVPLSSTAETRLELCNKMELKEGKTKRNIKQEECAKKSEGDFCSLWPTVGRPLCPAPTVSKEHPLACLGSSGSRLKRKKLGSWSTLSPPRPTFGVPASSLKTGLLPRSWPEEMFLSQSLCLLTFRRINISIQHQ